MKIVCPHCNYTKEIDDSVIPANAKSATCPSCKQKFPLRPEAASPIPPAQEESRESLAADVQSAATEFGARAEQVNRAGREERAPEAAPPPPLPPEGARPAPAGFAPPNMVRAAQTQPQNLEPIPWEVRRGSLFGDLWETWKLVLFKPNEFFDRMVVNPRTGYLSYGVIINTIGIVFTFLLYFVFFMVVGILAQESEGLPLIGGVVVFAVVVLLSPLLALLGLYVGGGILHLFLRIVGAGGRGFQTTLRTICYSGSPQVFNIVPYLGAMAGGIYALVLMILGLPKAHDTSVGRVVVGVLVLPIVFVFGFVAVVGVIAAIVIPMVMR
jgi:predicted Zn finger-like uncharacterized protein